MIIGVPREIKVHEYRVGLTPFGVRSFKQQGHDVLLQKGAGLGSGYSDTSYQEEGATLVNDAHDIFAKSEMIIKVKEPQKNECGMFKKGQILFTYLHLASDQELTKALIETGITAYAYETIRDENDSLPCLIPMSEIAGRVATQQGAKYLEREFGGKGILLGGVPGVRRGKVLILGGGAVGFNAAEMAVGLGADVTVMDISKKCLNEIYMHFGTSIHTLYSNEANIEEQLPLTDVVIGAALIPGRKAPVLVKRKHLKTMSPGTVLVDVAVDQGGCFESSRPTTHDNPVFIEDEIVHYCVSNMPGAVPQTSTQALTQQTLPFGLKIASSPLSDILKSEPGLSRGLSIHDHHLTCPDVAAALNMDYKKLS